jgi:hypothetical protein
METNEELYDLEVIRAQSIGEAVDYSEINLDK